MYIKYYFRAGKLSMKKTNKQKSSVVAIYGYSANNFRWRQINDKNVYHTTGIIISSGNKKYILSNRAGLIGCQNIISYYSHPSSKKIILRQNLTILYQSIWLNFIILGTEGSDCFDQSQSQIIGQSFVCPDEIDGYTISNNYIPVKNREYYLIRPDIDLASKKLNFTYHIHPVIFSKNVIYDKTYVLATIVHQFNLDTTGQMVGIHGSLITSANGRIVGIVSGIDKKKIYVTPVAILHQAINQFLSKLDDMGKLTIPIFYQIDNNCAIIPSNCRLDTNDKSICLKVGDQIKKIDGKKISVKKDQIWLNDSNLMETIPLDIYLGLNLRSNSHNTISLMRKEKKITADITNVSVNKWQLPLTDQPSFKPTDSIPYVNMLNIIMVQLTHELIDILTRHKINLSNNFVEKIWDGLLPHTEIVLIIDCLDNNLMERYNLPTIDFLNTDTLNFYVVKQINGKNIRQLDDIGMINSNIIKINMIDPFDKELSIILSQ